MKLVASGIRQGWQLFIKHWQLSDFWVSLSCSWKPCRYLQSSLSVLRSDLERDVARLVTLPGVDNAGAE